MDFKITRGGAVCAVCSRSFSDRETFFVALARAVEDEQVFQRSDICTACWERQEKAGEGRGFTAWWPAEFSSAKKPALLDPDTLWQVFHRALADDSGLSVEDRAGFAYVAALGLMRLKKLKLKSSRRTPGGEILVLETPGRRASERRLYEIVNPGLDEAGVDLVQDRLAELV